MDLKSFREDKLKIKTQSAFAELLEVEQSNVSRWEKDPSSITFPIIQRILEKTGASYEELTGWKKPVPKALNIKDTWEKADFTKCTLSDYIAKALEEFELPEEQRKAYIDDLQIGINSKLIKPKVAIVGRSDTGKSTLINALLGTDKMPTAWTPTTSIAVYIKHISEKPSFIEEDAWVFANHIDEERTWDEARLYDEAYCRSWKIAAGGIEILRSFGTRQGENYDRAAGSAVIFIDAPILKTCNIIDLPGFGTETENDDNITFNTAQKADVIIYLSQANGFMRIEDITYLKRNIKELPIWEKINENTLSPLSNLFVVASQAHTVNNGNRIQLKEILDVGCANLLKTLSNEYWDERKEISGYNYSDGGYTELRSRFFSYSVDISDLCSPFNEALTQVLETLPIIINNKTKEFVKEYVDSRKPNLRCEIEKYEGIVSERDKYIQLLTEIEKNELSRIKDNDKRKKGIREQIRIFGEESVNEFSDYATSLINTDSIITLLKEKGVKNKKDDVELFCSSLQSMIQEKCEKILSEKCEKLSEMTKDYITEYKKSISHPFETHNIKADFDAGWAFATALSKIGVVGGLGLFLSKGAVASLLLSTCHHLSVYGAIAGTSWMGPVGIGISLAIIGAIGAVKLFGGGWEKSVAKKIVSSFDENNFGEKFRIGIREYWENTENVFEQTTIKLDEEWNSYVDNLRKTVNEYDIQEIQNKIISLNNISDFFENIPL